MNFKKIFISLLALSFSAAAGAVHDHFQDGAMFAFHFIDKDELKKQRDRMDYYQWHLNPAERMALDYKRK